MKTCRALVSSRPNAGSREPALTRASIRSHRWRLEDALVDRERAHAMHDRKRSSLLLMSISSGPAPTVAMIRAENAQVGDREGLDQRCEPGQKCGLAAHPVRTAPPSPG